MELIYSTEDKYIIRLDPGDELISSIYDICKKNSIDSAWFQALGAASKVKIAFYDLDKKEYISQEIKENLEILNIIGNVAYKEADLFVHGHGTFGKRSMDLIGGHVKECHISATAEIMLNPISAKINRKFDPSLGLHVFDSE